jgi:hypothetical protein
VGVSLVGATKSSVARLTSLLCFVGVLGGAGFYLYGPAVTPALHSAAMAECNDLTGGNYRSYSLVWVPSTRPHWLCGDRSDLEKPPVDLGWWVTPRF